MYFLAIVPRENVLRGDIRPGYILCVSHGKSEARTHLRVSNVLNGEKCKHPKMLVSSPLEHPEMIDFLSYYRTREHMHRGKYIHKATKKYFPIGALFWFECNIYGEITGPPIYVKNVPDRKRGQKADTGKIELDKNRNKEYTVKDLLTRDPYSEENKYSNIKIKTGNPSKDKKRRSK